jgi:hypothetical protein
MLAGLVATASAVPRISLDFSGTTTFAVDHASVQPAGFPKSRDDSKIFKLAEPIVGEHDKGYTQPDGTTKVQSRQDFTERCPAGGTAKSTIPDVNCHIPKASAHDHHQGNIDVETRVFLVNNDGVAVNEEMDYAAKGIACVNFDKRSTYLFKYDAADLSGNRADQLVFALILDDTTKPEIIGACGDETVNAATGTCATCDKTWKLCSNDIVTDNVDGDLTHELSYVITRLNGDADPNTPCPLVAPCNRAKAQVAISTLYQAQYEVLTTAKDHAKWYGTNFNSNIQTKTRVITVSDKPEGQEGGDDFNIPTITMHPASIPNGVSATDEVHECATQYTDEGAYANDKLDDALNAGDCAKDNACVTVHNANLVPGYNGQTGAPATGKYTVTYTAQDSHLNPALSQLRNVFVTDTTDPVISLVADTDGDLETINHHASASNDAIGEVSSTGSGSISDPGVTCIDTCDKTSLPITTSWETTWNPQVVGCYNRNYVCKDKSTNSMSIQREFCNVDEDAPILTLNHDTLDSSNQANVEREAANDAVYTDAGAKCYDYHHHLVKVVLDNTALEKTKENTYGNALDTGTTGEYITGDVVDMSVPGVYHITYKCTDKAGNKANDATRTVTVKDTVAPVITRTGDSTIIIEAGFKYTDLGATATDTLDGTITGKITKTVTTLEGSNSFAELVSSTSVDVPKVGKYELSYHVLDKAENPAAIVKRTIVVKDTLPPVITLKVGDTLLHTSSHAALGVNNVANPAGKSNTLGTSVGSNPNIDA